MLFQIKNIAMNKSEQNPYFWRRPELILIGIVNIVLFLSAILYMGLFFWNGQGLINFNFGIGWGFLVNTILLLFFSVGHSLFLTPKWKRKFSKIVPRNMFFTLYSIHASLSLILLFIFWTPFNGYIFSLDGGYALIMRILYILSWVYMGWAMMETGALSQNGIKDWWDTLKESKTNRENSFTGPYKYHRHPIYISFLGIIWFLPHMSWDRLYIALFWTLYTLIGATFKEARLRRNKSYQNYLNNVPPFPGFPRMPLAELWSKLIINFQGVFMKLMKSFSALAFILILGLPTSLKSETLSQFYRFENFDQAEGSTNFIRFTVKSTKIGLFTSDVPGFAKRFFIKGDFDFEKNQSQKMSVEFKIIDLDTDNSSRDEKLKDFCLEEKKYKKIIVSIPGPYSLSSGEKKVKGKITIRGVVHEIDITLNIEKKKNLVIVNGKSMMTLSGLKIPDPSIVIAKLSDDIKIDFKFLLGK